MADGNDIVGAEGPSGEQSGNDSQDFSNWMSNLPAGLCSEPLKNIAIPGSHDSFSFYLDITSLIAPDSSNTIRNLVTTFGAVAKKIVHAWSVTQSLTFKEQFDRGIRYVDLRVSSRSNINKPDLYFAHGLFGNTVESCLREMNAWLEAHPKEVVLLDFNHFYSMTSEHHQTLSLMILQIFGDKVTPIMNIETCTLNDLWANQWQVIIFYAHEPITIDHTKLWPACSIVSVWPNTAVASEMVNRLEASLTNERPTDRFYVSQGVLTPTDSTISLHILRSLKDVLATDAMKHLLVFLKDKSVGSQGINIVIADFIELEGYVAKVLALNSSK